MKRFVAIGIGVVVLLAIGMVYSVWRASQEPVTRTPGALETGRMQLHAQLEQAKATEGAAEKQHWNSPGQLRALIESHQQRLEKLKYNKEAAEIVAYDRDAIDRLEKRIAQLAEEEAAKAEAAKEAARQAAKLAAQESQQQ
jgi:hypothetical protein